MRKQVLIVPGCLPEPESGIVDSLAPLKTFVLIECPFSQICDLNAERLFSSLRCGISRNNAPRSRTRKKVRQGGVISPVLANIFLHVVFDKWMEINFPDCPFEWYADDIIIHVKNEPYASKVLSAVSERLKECKLELHTEKGFAFPVSNIFAIILMSSIGFFEGLTKGFEIIAKYLIQRKRRGFKQIL